MNFVKVFVMKLNTDSVWHQFNSHSVMVQNIPQPWTKFFFSIP